MQCCGDNLNLLKNSEMQGVQRLVISYTQNDVKEHDEICTSILKMRAYLISYKLNVLHIAFTVPIAIANKLGQKHS